MRIIEVWSCKGREMYQVSRMFTDSEKAKTYINEIRNEKLTPENCRVEYWVRIWIENGKGELITDSNQQIW